jgi:hypothetical protein
MAKTGRPSLYSEKLSESVLEGLAEGKSLVDVCKAAAMPSARTVLQWAADNTEFSQRYMRAREVQAEHMDNLIVETAKKAQDDPQAARVQIDAYKWRAAKLRALSSASTKFSARQTATTRRNRHGAWGTGSSSSRVSTIRPITKNGRAARTT